MNKHLIAKGMIALMLAASAPVFAQHNDRHDRRDDRGDHRDDRRDDRGNRDNNRGNYGNYGNDRHDDRRDDRHARRGAGPRHDLYRGNRLPGGYHHKQYVVDNWRSHRLSAPPRGYHWVQVGNDYVLAAVATGIIASVLLGN